MSKFVDTRLTALAHVLRLGSFDAAAEALSVTPSAISQRIKALEDQMGTVLVLRGQPCTATDAGRALAAHFDKVSRLEHELDSALGESGGPAARPDIRIAINSDTLDTWFPFALSPLKDYSFQLFVEDQDHSAELLRRGEVAAAVSANSDPIQGCDTHALGALRYLATASPDFVQTWFSEGVTAKSLAKAPVLQFNEKDKLQARWAAREIGRSVTMPTQRLPSTRGFLTACLHGMAWGMNPEGMVRRPINRGRLVELPGNAVFDTPLYWHVSRIGAKTLAPLTKSVLETAASSLIQND